MKKLTLIIPGLLLAQMPMVREEPLSRLQRAELEAVSYKYQLAEIQLKQIGKERDDKLAEICKEHNFNKCTINERGMLVEVK